MTRYRSLAQREHDAFMSHMAARQRTITQRLMNLDDGLEQLEALAELREQQSQLMVDGSDGDEQASRGLSTTELGQLTTHRHVGSETTCAICLCDVDEGESVCTLACCHL